MRVLGAALGVIVGWILGVWGYAAALEVITNPKPGGVHVGALACGGLGALALAVVGVRIAGRIGTRSDVATRVTDDD